MFKAILKIDGEDDPSIFASEVNQIKTIFHGSGMLDGKNSLDWVECFNTTPDRASEMALRWRLNV